MSEHFNDPGASDLVEMESFGKTLRQPMSLHESARHVGSNRASEVNLIAKRITDSQSSSCGDRNGMNIDQQQQPQQQQQQQQDKRATSVFFFNNAEMTQNHKEDLVQSKGDYIHSVLPQFKKTIWDIKLKFLMGRMLNTTRSYMFKHLTARQFSQINDKASTYLPNQQKKQMLNSSSSSNSTSKISQILGQKQIKKSLSLNKNGKKVRISSDSSGSSRQEVFSKVLGYLQQNAMLQQLIKAFDKRVPVLEPTSTQKVVWDFVSLFLILVYAVQVPLFLTFHEHRMSISHWGAIISIPMFMFCDIIVAINTGCYEKGVLIKKRAQLIQINLQKLIIPNIIVIVSFAIYILAVFSNRYRNEDEENRWIGLILLTVSLKLVDFNGIMNKLQEHSILSKQTKNAIDLIKLILTILYISHLLACFWVFVAQIEAQMDVKTWAKFTLITDVAWYTLYVDAFYFTTVTMITVGYGDFIPVNEIEKFICIIVMIFSCGIFAYSMNTIGSILESFNEDAVKKATNMAIINAYMTRKNVSKPVKNSIREYLDFYWKEQSERDQESEDRIIGCLSDNLKKALLLESKNVVLKKSAIFRTHFSDAVKEKIVPIIKEYRCSPEELICVEGERDNCSIFFIEKGSVEIVIKSNDISAGMLRPIASLGVGDSFGEQCFFAGGTRKATIRAREFTTLLILERAEFLALLMNHQQDYERFCMIKDSIGFYHNYSLINLGCLACKSKTHSINSCPRSHYIPNQDLLMKDFMHDPGQSRSPFTARHISRRSNSLISKSIITDYAEKYQHEHEESIEFATINAFIKEGYNSSSVFNSQQNHQFEDEEDDDEDSDSEDENRSEDGIGSDCNNNSDIARNRFNHGSSAGNRRENDDRTSINRQISHANQSGYMNNNNNDDMIAETNSEDDSDQSYAESYKHPVASNSRPQSIKESEDNSCLEEKEETEVATVTVAVTPPVPEIESPTSQSGGTQNKLGSRLGDLKKVFQKSFSPKEKKALFAKQSSKTSELHSTRDKIGQVGYLDKALKTIRIASYFDINSPNQNKKSAFSSASANMTHQRKEDSPHTRNQQHRLTYQSPPVGAFKRRGSQYNRNNFLAPQLIEFQQRRTPFTRVRGRQVSRTDLNSAYAQPSRTTPSFRNRRQSHYNAASLRLLGLQSLSIPQSSLDPESQLINSNNNNNGNNLNSEIPDAFFASAERGVEDCFDIMQNFKFYFPQNNSTFQIELLGLPLHIRRQMLLWDSFQCMTSSLMGHYSQLTSNQSAIQSAYEKYNKRMQKGNPTTILPLRSSLRDKQKSMPPGTSLSRGVSEMNNNHTPSGIDSFDDNLLKNRHKTYNLITKQPSSKIELGDSVFSGTLIHSMQGNQQQQQQQPIRMNSSTNQIKALPVLEKQNSISQQSQNVMAKLQSLRAQMNNQSTHETSQNHKLRYVSQQKIPSFNPQVTSGSTANQPSRFLQLHSKGTLPSAASSILEQQSQIPVVFQSNNPENLANSSENILDETNFGFQLKSKNMADVSFNQDDALFNEIAEIADDVFREGDEYQAIDDIYEVNKLGRKDLKFSEKQEELDVNSIMDVEQSNAEAYRGISINLSGIEGELKANDSFMQLEPSLLNFCVIENSQNKIQFNNTSNHLQRSSSKTEQQQQQFKSQRTFLHSNQLVCLESQLQEQQLQSNGFPEEQCSLEAAGQTNVAMVDRKGAVELYDLEMHAVSNVRTAFDDFEGGDEDIAEESQSKLKMSKVSSLQSVTEKRSNKNANQKLSRNKPKSSIEQFKQY